MPKRKKVSGMLCRDQADGWTKQPIVFFTNAKRKDVELDWGCWYVANYEFPGRIVTWTPARWEKNYSLAPPKPGKCFEVEIEL